MKSLASVLFVVFLVLKLLGKIDWSWWLIALPLLIQFFAIVILAIWSEVSPLSFYRTFGGRK